MEEYVYKYKLVCLCSNVILTDILPAWCSKCGNQVYFSTTPTTSKFDTITINPTIDHPKHYTFGKIEVVDFIEAWNLDYCDGNIIKYVVRAKHKGNELEDLKKAEWYLKRRIALLADKIYKQEKTKG